MPRAGKSSLGRKPKRRNNPNAQVPSNEQNSTSNQDHADSIEEPDVEDMDVIPTLEESGCHSQSDSPPDHGNGQLSHHTQRPLPIQLQKCKNRRENKLKSCEI